MSLTTVVDVCLPWLNKLSSGTEKGTFKKTDRIFNQKVFCIDSKSNQDISQNFKICPFKVDEFKSRISKPNLMQPEIAHSSCSDRRENMSQGGFVDVLKRAREPIADYHESRGLPKTEHYGFVSLISSLATQSYNAILTIITMLYNLVPLVEGFSYLARFILDKMIEICETETRQDKCIKISLFIGEMCVLMLLVMIISSFILLPVWYLFSQMAGKVWHTLLSSG